MWGKKREERLKNGGRRLIFPKKKIEGFDLVTIMIIKSTSFIVESSNLHLIAQISKTQLHMSSIHLRLLETSSENGLIFFFGSREWPYLFDTIYNFTRK